MPAMLPERAQVQVGKLSTEAFIAALSFARENLSQRKAYILGELVRRVLPKFSAESQAMPAPELAPEHEHEHEHEQGLSPKVKLLTFGAGSVYYYTGALGLLLSVALYLGYASAGKIDQTAIISYIDTNLKLSAAEKQKTFTQSAAQELIVTTYFAFKQTQWLLRIVGSLVNDLRKIYMQQGPTAGAKLKQKA